MYIFLHSCHYDQCKSSSAYKVHRFLYLSLKGTVTHALSVTSLLWSASFSVHPLLSGPRMWSSLGTRSSGCGRHSMCRSAMVSTAAGWELLQQNACTQKSMLSGSDCRCSDRHASPYWTRNFNIFYTFTAKKNGQQNATPLSGMSLEEWPSLCCYLMSCCLLRQCRHLQDIPYIVHS